MSLKILITASPISRSEKTSIKNCKVIYLKKPDTIHIEKWYFNIFNTFYVWNKTLVEPEKAIKFYFRKSTPVLGIYLVSNERSNTIP